ncbi:hypothetical protein LOSG293_110530 [Secundilactobacillus oryzae JCM 18671]|uniref:Uncharacterized protein n=1 Tax=Secundilactobacillus oryzae JCM 18671 TaxID=1291743 RepID=A0A081BI69_9LACO|nr:hypothetical protein [Secundilactobacillus oryzae]GAK47737.1 hypothetical protein LOSG293_110530 [Secundilactobacillus oryzae JCM 18671]
MTEIKSGLVFWVHNAYPIYDKLFGVRMLQIYVAYHVEEVLNMTVKVSYSNGGLEHYMYFDADSLQEVFNSPNTVVFTKEHGI